MATRPHIGDGSHDVLDRDVVAAMRAQLATVAQDAVTAVTEEVAEYGATLRGDMARDIQSAVALALGTFLRLVDPDPGASRAPIDAARDGAYELGRGEARVGRTADALLAAYRVGARASWRELSATAVEHGTSAPAVARLAELVFAYIDELSAASVAGHADERAASGRLQQQRRQELGRALLSGTPRDRLSELAERAAWPVPETLTAVLLPSARTHEALPRLASTTLVVPADAVDLPIGEDQSVVLVADVVRTRAHLLQVLHGRAAVVGPPRPWAQVAGSLQIALRARATVDHRGPQALDTAAHLDTLVVTADAGALDDLRADVLAPLAALTPATQERLTETLRAWLLHLGRRRDAAGSLHVHPQTVRYRMNQLRELYGDRLDDPATVQALTVALASP